MQIWSEMVGKCMQYSRCYRIATCSYIDIHYIASHPRQSLYKYITRNGGGGEYAAHSKLHVLLYFIIIWKEKFSVHVPPFPDRNCNSFKN